MLGQTTLLGNLSSTIKSVIEDTGKMNARTNFLKGMNNNLHKKMHTFSFQAQEVQMPHRPRKPRVIKLLK